MLKTPPSWLLITNFVAVKDNYYSAQKSPPCIIQVYPERCARKNGRFYTKDALYVWMNLGKYFVVCLGYASLV